MHSMAYLEHVTRLCAGVLPLLMRSVAVERLSAALPDPSDLPLVMEDKCFSHERPAGCVCTMGDLVLLWTETLLRVFSVLCPSSEEKGLFNAIRTALLGLKYAESCDKKLACNFLLENDIRKHGNNSCFQALICDCCTAESLARSPNEDSPCAEAHKPLMHSLSIILSQDQNANTATKYPGLPSPWGLPGSVLSAWGVENYHCPAAGAVLDVASREVQHRRAAHVVPASPKWPP